MTITTYWGNTLLPESVTTKAGDNSIIATERFVYNIAGLVTKQTDAEGNSTHFIYDAVGRKIGEISEDPDGSGPLPRLATRTTYNDDDQPTSVKTGTVVGTNLAALEGMMVSKEVVTAYDSIGRKNSEAVVAGGETYAITQYSYDAWNRVICRTQRMNLVSPPADACTLGAMGSNGYDRITKNEYDEAGQLKKVYRAYGTPLQQVYQAYEYSDNGKQTDIIDANNNTAHLAYDGYDRQTHWYFPSKTKGSLAHSVTDFEMYEYDLNDNRIAYRKRDGQVLEYNYDNLNRLTHKMVPVRLGLSSWHTQDVFYGYDNQGLALYSRFDSHSGQGVSQAYNALGQMTASSINMDGVARTLSYENNLVGIRTKVTHPDNQGFTHSLDNRYRLSGITHPSAGMLAGYSYQTTGELDILSGGISSDYDYDEIGRVSSLHHNLAENGFDNTWGFVYNPVSQIKQLSTSNGYFAPAHALRNASYAVNGLNQYTTVAGIAHTYDDNGNLSSDGDTFYSYDQENRLVKATTAAGSLKAELFYDPNGRLYKITTPSVSTYLLYDGDELVAEYPGTSTTVAQRYVHGLSVDDPVVWFTGSAVDRSNKKHLRANHQGSIVVVSDAEGNKQQLLRYDTWGEPQQPQELRFGYTGQIWIPELELWYYKARFYSPELGRFLQTDPVGYEDQMNLYAYVGNDPLNLVDPSGKEACPGHESSSCIQSDNFDTSKSNGQTTEASQSTENAMLKGMDKVAVTSGTEEKIGFVTVDGSGNQKVETADGASTGSDGVRDSASAGVPQNATAVIHGHIDGVTDGVNSDGDTSSLTLSSPIPNGTVSNGRLGVTEIVNGQVRFRMIKGTMRNGERRRLQKNINRQQPNFHR